MAADQTFHIRYGAFRPLLSILGLGPAFSRVVVGTVSLSVHMGWGFRAEIPLTAITDARTDDRMVGGIGVHGFRGRWLVNGAASGLVAITIDPPARALVIGVPVKLRFLRVSVEDPDALLAALRR